MEALLKQFLKEEATPYVRKLIVDAVNEHEARPSEVQRRFEFNRFEVTLDFRNNVALIEDVLDSTPSGEIRLQLGAFIATIEGEEEPGQTPDNPSP